MKLKDSLLEGLKRLSSDLLGKEDRVYLDYNSTTPIAPIIKDHLLNWCDSWGNPSSINWSGRKPKLLIRESRNKIAKMLGINPIEIVFTSGGSESNNLAIKGAFDYFSSKKSERNIWLTTKVEHPSLLKSFESISLEGAEVIYINVNRFGQIDIAQYQKTLDQYGNKIALVSVMLANNETGNIFPIKKMAKAAHKFGALFHTDAVQALGKVNLNLDHLGVDMASFSGHKFYSLKGAGFLYLKGGLKILPQINGGGQERKLRAGTENTLAIASMGLMSEYGLAEARTDDLDGNLTNNLNGKTVGGLVVEQSLVLATLRDYLQKRIIDEIPDVVINGYCISSSGEVLTKRLSNTLNVTIAGIDGESLLMNMDIKGFAISTGSACSSGSPEPSKTLRAMGLTRKEAQSSMRVSLGWGSTKEQLDFFVDTLVLVVKRLRKISDYTYEDQFRADNHVEGKLLNTKSEAIDGCI